MNKNSLKSYLIAILIPLAVGGFSYLLTRNHMNLYDEVLTPALAPPAFLFPIVWTILYVLMGVSSYMVLQVGKDRNKAEEVFDALYVYGLQLFLNFTWSIFFFNLRAFLFAFIWILLLWAGIALMIVKFYKLNRTAAYLQIPYLVWVTFAAYLTFEIFRLND